MTAPPRQSPPTAPLGLPLPPPNPGSPERQIWVGPSLKFVSAPCPPPTTFPFPDWALLYLHAEWPGDRRVITPEGSWTFDEIAATMTPSSGPRKFGEDLSECQNTALTVMGKGALPIWGSSMERIVGYSPVCLPIEDGYRHVVSLVTTINSLLVAVRGERKQVLRGSSTRRDKTTYSIRPSFKVSGLAVIVASSAFRDGQADWAALRRDLDV